MATLVVDVHVNACFTPCSPGGTFPCCGDAASINLTAGQYVVTMTGQECSSDNPGCNTSDGSGPNSGSGCLPISFSGVCAGETGVCNFCAIGHPAGGPVLINHLGGAFRAWRNDCFSRDNFGIYTFEFFPVPPDTDGDGVPDPDDNCPNDANPDQADADGDDQGDVCDPDDDNDGVLDISDNCPLIANLDQADNDLDTFGDICDGDDDNDGVGDLADNCPFLANPDQADADGDGQGNVCDGDLDGDGVANAVDNCPLLANSNQNDFDVDGVGDVCDADLDADGVENGSDVCAFTLLGEVVDPATGCSIAQLCPCQGPRGTTGAWKNHGQYVSCVAKSAESFVGLGLMTQAEKDAKVSAAALSSCGSR